MSDHTSDHISDRTSPRDDPAQTARKWQIRAEALSAALGKEASQRDRSRTLAHDEFAALSASGVLAVTLPVTHGGDALNTVALANIIVTLAKGDSNIAQALQPHFCGIEKLRIYGTQAQRAHHFAAVADGALLTNAAAEKHTAVVGDVRQTRHRLGARRPGRTDDSGRLGCHGTTHHRQRHHASGRCLCRSRGNHVAPRTGQP